MFWGLGFKGIFTHLAITFSIRYLLDMPRVKHIVEDPQDPSMRLLLFSEAIAQPGAIALLCLACLQHHVQRHSILSLHILFLIRFGRRFRRENIGRQRNRTSGRCAARGGSRLLLLACRYVVEFITIHV